MAWVMFVAYSNPFIGKSICIVGITRFPCRELQYKLLASSHIPIRSVLVNETVI